LQNALGYWAIGKHHADDIGIAHGGDEIVTPHAAVRLGAAVPGFDANAIGKPIFSPYAANNSKSENGYLL
jgi:hypothetical protein